MTVNLLRRTPDARTSHDASASISSTHGTRPPRCSRCESLRPAGWTETCRVAATTMTAMGGRALVTGSALSGGATARRCTFARLARARYIATALAHVDRRRAWVQSVGQHRNAAQQRVLDQQAGPGLAWQQRQAEGERRAAEAVHEGQGEGGRRRKPETSMVSSPLRRRTMTCTPGRRSCPPKLRETVYRRRLRRRRGTSSPGRQRGRLSHSPHQS
ncbi:uncharacterized protein B0H18DRAFT_660791 [Fomitopsis serialis]|uniref:uncharacterized protein n=1 Tax=Fomitopsis serialis TaxID=139415 RepID=UPI002008C69E|nr:uncharacterized protein B0H18DRAFT_660791 [Neoantrodia serialis]KAH9918854.1 hypothetical protein B0H18DRAFT_660791 [Neoantrodia serialis]